MEESRLTDSCDNCPAAWENFKYLSREELRLVNENRYEATFKPGEIILKQGAPALHAVFLSKGMAKIYIEGARSKNYIIEIALPSRMIIGPGVYANNRNSFSVVALSPVQSCFISLDIFNRLIGENAGFAAGMIRDLSLKSYFVQSKLMSLTQKKMPGRLAETILYFADEIYQSQSFEMMLTRQELGEMTNMTRESVVRILKELEQSGVIRSGTRRIDILDSNRLRQISESA